MDAIAPALTAFATFAWGPWLLVLLLGGGAQQFLVQVTGVAAGFLWAFPVSLAIFWTINKTIGLRVSEAEEMEGLDVTEHGMHAYPPGLTAEGVASRSCRVCLGTRRVRVRLDATILPA